MMHSPIATRRTATGIPTGRLAVWWVLTSEVFIFGGLIMCFVLYKFNGAPGFEEAAMTNTPAGAFNTFVLLTSSLTIVLAHAAAERKELKKCFKYIWFTIFGGLVFALVKTYEYTSKIFPEWYHTPATHEPITIFSNVFWSFYFTATGLHALHVFGGMIIMAMISMDVLKGRNLQRVELIGLYWHFVDIVWIFLFPLLYIANF
jgi:heme/copper-type cytochrome/quinol oxidase subunit 3